VTHACDRWFKHFEEKKTVSLKAGDKYVAG